MKLNEDKVMDYINAYGAAIGNGFTTDHITDVNENSIVFKYSNDVLTFSVNDNKVSMTLDSSIGEEEHFKMIKEYTYMEDKVEYSYYLDKYYYEDNYYKRDKEPILFHQERSFTKDLNIDDITPISELYTPLKIK